MTARAGGIGEVYLAEDTRLHREERAKSLELTASRKTRACCARVSRRAAGTAS
jgi:hypothetical protein